MSKKVFLSSFQNKKEKENRKKKKKLWLTCDVGTWFLVSEPID